MHDGGDDEAPARRENDSSGVCSRLATRREEMPHPDASYEQRDYQRRTLAIRTPLRVNLCVMECGSGWGHTDIGS